jgi:hypothetical protein
VPRAKKLESLPTSTLVEAFINKWSLDKVVVTEATTVNGLRSFGVSVQTTSIPVVIEHNIKGKSYYYVCWKCSLIELPYIDRLKKDFLLHPQNHFEMFKLKQLEEAEQCQQNLKNK